jgi:hypothetical protein
MKVNFKSVILLIFIIIAVITAVSMFNRVNSDKTDFTYGNLKQLLEEDAVIECVIDGDLVAHVKAYAVKTTNDGKLLIKDNGEFDYVGKGDPATIKEYTCELMYNFQIDKIDNLVENCESIEYYNYLKAEETPWYMTYLPFIIIGVLFIIL